MRPIEEHFVNKTNNRRIFYGKPNNIAVLRKEKRKQFAFM